MLRVYSYDDFSEEYTAHSTDGSNDYPVRTLHDTLETSVVQKKLFLRNNDSDYYYLDVYLRWGPSTVTVNNSAGWSYKLMVQDRQPTEAEWAAISSGDTASIGDIGSSETADLDFYPFWVRIVIPQAAPSTIFQNADIIVGYSSENPVA